MCDIQATIARIDRALDESAKRLARAKEPARRWIVPLTVVGAVLVATIARLPEILSALGVGR